MSRLSDEKLNHLSHVLIEALGKLKGIAFAKQRNPARLRILRLLTDGVRAEDELQERIRQKIGSTKRQVPEGSAEWEILFRRYYEEELFKHMPPAEKDS